MTKHLFWKCLIVVLMAVTVDGAEIPREIALSRPLAIAMAVSHNSELKVDSYNVLKAEKAAAGSHGIYDPLLETDATFYGSRLYYDDYSPMSREVSGSIRLSQLVPIGGTIRLGTSTYFYTSLDRTGDDSWNPDLTLQISQPLLKNVGIEVTEVNISLSENALAGAREDFTDATNSTVYDTIIAYNRLYTLRQHLQSREEAMKSAEDLLTELRRRTESQRLPLEIANAEYNVAQRRSALVDAYRDVQDAESRLRFVIGLYEKVHILPTDPPSREEPPDSEDRAEARALENRADLKSLKIASESAELLSRYAENQALPELNFFTELQLAGEGEVAAEAYEQIREGVLERWSAGLVFSYPLGNTFARNNQLESRLRARQAQTEVSTLAWKIREEVDNAMRTLISNRLQLVATEKSLNYAQLRREEYVKGLQKGTATVQNLIDASNDLTQARESYADALEAFAGNVSRLWRETGELLERNHVVIKVSEVAMNE